MKIPLFLLFLAVFVQLNTNQIFASGENHGISHLNKDKLSNLVEMALSLSRRYFAPCSVLIHPYNRKHLPYPIFAFMKMLTFSNNSIVSVAQSFVDYAYYISEQDHEKCSRTMNIIFGEDHLIRDQFNQLTHQVLMSGPVWLVILNKKVSITEFFGDGFLPFDIDLVVAQQQDDGLIDLHEAYRVSKDYPIRLIHYGNWTLSSGLIAPDHISLYFRRNDFEGLVFQVGGSDSFPVVQIKNRNGEISFTGYFANVWEELSLRLNFSSNYIEVDGGSGMMYNKSWTGVTGAVIASEADIGVAAFTITPERYSYVDFLRPLIVTRNTLFLKNPGIEIRWDAIFRPFGDGVWICLLVWIVCASLFLKVFVYLGEKNHFEPTKISSDFTLLNSFFYMLRAFSQQATPNVPENFSSRIILITSYFASVVLLTAYSGALISFIAVEIPRLPFDDLTGLVNQGSYALQVVTNTAAYMSFANTTNPVMQNAFGLMAQDLPKKMEQGLERLCYQQKLAHFGPQAIMDLIVRRLNLQGCNIISLPQPLSSVYLSIIIKKRSQYIGVFNHHLDMMIYQGLLGRLRKQLWPTLGPYSPKNIIEVQTEQVIPIYMVLVVGITLSAVMLALEVLKNQRYGQYQERLFKKHFLSAQI